MSGEKTEQPTQHKLKKLREEGQLPPRKNVVEAVLILSAIAALVFLMPSFADALKDLLKDIVPFAGGQPLDEVTAAVSKDIMKVLILLLAFCWLTASVTLFTTLLLNKFNVAPKAMTPKAQHFSPVSRVKSIFGKTNLYNFLRMFAFFIFVFLVFVLLVRGNIENAINASYCGFICVGPLFIHLIKTFIITVILFLLVFAGADFLIQTKLFISQNKMSKDDVKRENKEQQGNPEIKAARSGIAHEDAVQPTIDRSTHVVFSDDMLVAVIFYPEDKSRPYVVTRLRGSRVADMISQLKKTRIPTFYMPNAMPEFYGMARPGQYMPPSSAKVMAKVMEEVERRQQGSA